MDLAVVPVGREVGRRGVLAVDSPAGEVAARLQDPILRRGDKLHIVAVDGLEDLPPPHGHADGDALGHGGRGGHRRGIQAVGCRGLHEGVAPLGLDGDDLGVFGNQPRRLELLHGLDHAEEQRAVAQGHEQVLGQPPQLLVDLVEVGFGALVEEGVVDVVGVVPPLLVHLGAADVGAVVAASGDHVGGGAVGFNHGDLSRRGALGHVDITLDAAPAAVGSHAVACVAGAVLHGAFHADGLHMRHQHRRAAILEGKGGHIVVHFEEHVVGEGNQRRHALAQGDLLPRVSGEGQKPPVPEEPPHGLIHQL